MTDAQFAKAKKAYMMVDSLGADHPQARSFVAVLDYLEEWEFQLVMESCRRDLSRRNVA